MNQLFTTLLYQPILNLLILAYQYLGHDLGTAAIVVTLIIRLLLWPWYQKNALSQRSMTKLQPKLQDIQKKYKTEPQKQTQELMALYREHKVSPSGMFLFMFAQFAILITLYRVFQGVLSPTPPYNLLYGFVAQPGALNNMFLGFLNLSQPNIYLAMIVAIAQYFQSKISMKAMPRQGKTGAFNQNLMLYFMPGLIFFVYLKLSSILALYWLIMTLVGIVQETIVNKKFAKQNIQ